MNKNSHITNEEKALLLRIMKYFQDRKDNKNVGKYMNYAIKRTMDATGASKCTVIELLKDMKRFQNTLETPSTSKMFSAVQLAPRKRLTSENDKHNEITLNELYLCGLRNVITKFYVNVKKIPSLGEIFLACKTVLNFTGDITSLGKLLPKLGFKYIKTSTGDELLVMKPEFIALRSKFLRRLRENDEMGSEKKAVIYVHEPILGPNPQKQWTVLIAGESTESMDLSNLLNIITLINMNQSTMNIQQSYTCWIKEYLIPNIPPESIVVFNNPPHYLVSDDKKPSIALKADIEQWLLAHNIPYDENTTRAELYMLMKSIKTPRNPIEEVMKEYGHEMLSLPLHQNDLNPLEQVVPIVKQQIQKQYYQFSMEEIEREVMKDTFICVILKEWKIQVERVNSLREIYWQEDIIQEEFFSEAFNDAEFESSSEDETDGVNKNNFKSQASDSNVGGDSLKRYH